MYPFARPLPTLFLLAEKNSTSRVSLAGFLASVLVLNLVSWGWGQSVALPTPTDVGGAALPLPEDQLTTAEKTEFAATTSGPDVERLLSQWGRQAEHLRVLQFGTTVEGRRLLLGVLGSPLPEIVRELPNAEVSSPARLGLTGQTKSTQVPVPSQAALQQDQRLRVLIVANIHSGECSGKEALLQLTRELARERNHPWLEHALLLVVPNYNADGDAARGEHRQDQAGPMWVGQRENAQGLDINRDFTKLDAPETRALVQLFQAWQPDVLMDLHTTDGSAHRYPLTYDIPHHPAIPLEQRLFLSRRLLPQVTAQLQAEKLNTFFYGNFAANHARWESFGYGPRFSTEYAGLRGALAILSEDYSHAPFELRVRATHRFVSTCIEQLLQSRAEVLQLTRGSRFQVKADQPFPITAEVHPFPESVEILGYENDSPQAAPQSYRAQYWGDYRPAKSVNTPAAYLIPRTQTAIARNLLRHGVEVKRVTAGGSVPAAIYRVDSVERDATPYQGRILQRFTLAQRSEPQTVRPGDYVVETAQSLGRLAICLLEPQAKDSLASWGEFTYPLKQGTDYPLLRLESLAGIESHVVTELPAETPLSLTAVFHPEEKLAWNGNPSGTASWLPGQPLVRLTNEQGNFLLDARSGSIAPDNSREELARLLKRLPEFTEAHAEQLANSASTGPIAGLYWLMWRNELFVANLNRGSARQLTRDGRAKSLVTFSPNGKYLAFIRDHNLHVVEVETSETRALTTHGTEDLLCGELDWVYQEELYGRGNYQGYFWSPDSQRIAFLELNEAGVPVHYVREERRPTRFEERIHYPRVGDRIPSVRLGVVSAQGGGIEWIDEPTPNEERLIVRVSWSPESQTVLHQVQDRPQTWLELRATPLGGSTRVWLKETSPAWVEAIGTPTWLPDGRFLWLSDRTGARHIYLVTPQHPGVAAEGEQLAQQEPLTSGPWDVEQVLTYRAASRQVYFEGYRDSLQERHVYQVDITGQLCQRLTELGQSHSWEPDSSGAFFLDRHSSQHVPLQVTLRRADGEFLKGVSVLRQSPLESLRLGEVTSFQIPGPDHSQLPAMLILPPGLKPNETCPVLIYSYAGPQAPAVKNRWDGREYLWHQYLASQGIAVLTFDPLSSTHGGIRNAWALHKQFGPREFVDVQYVLNWLKRQPFADPERFAIWGWSYGGYFTAYSMMHSPDFRCGISVAPVTHWHNYDAIYTERYMGLKEDNVAGYESSSVQTHAAKLKGRMLLIHGAIDENVHPSNSLQLADKLQLAGRDFEFMLYPGNRHSISEPAHTFHLRQHMTEFLLRELRPAPPGQSE